MITKLMQEIKEKLEIIDKYLKEKEYLKVEERTLQLMQEKLDNQNDYENHLKDEIERLNKTNNVMEKYLELICDLGYDYDGCKTTGDLCLLINELVRYARLGRDYNTTETIFIDGKKKYNILNEELKEK